MTLFDLIIVATMSVVLAAFWIGYRIRLHRVHNLIIKNVIKNATAGLPRYTVAPDGKSITCHRCGLTSYNQRDIEHRYCGECHRFHDGY